MGGLSSSIWTTYMDQIRKDLVRVMELGFSQSSISDMVQGKAGLLCG
jgi:hypothetical protein